MKRTLYYDITNLIEWKGNLTGIPRVTDELALRFKESENVEFIRWDFAHEKFLLVDIEDYYLNIAPNNRAFFSKDKNHDSITPPDMGFVGITKRVVRSSPLLSRVVGDTVRNLRVVKHRYTNKKPKLAKKSRPISLLPLDKGATIFIPCGLWDNEVYIRSLLTYKEKGLKLAFLSYDILPIVVPQFSGQWGAPMIDFTKRITAECELVFSISQHTTSDLGKYLKKECKRTPKIVTVRLGDAFANSEPKLPTDPIFKKSGIAKTGEDFLLCTGTLEARKNHALLYYTYKLAASKGIKLPKLVVVGRPGYRTHDIINIIEDDPETKDTILLLKNVSDEELSWLYAHCKFSVYPSWYEGWGLPIAESISKGVPCIASNTSSMTEVAPDYADYFNPASPDDCLAMIQSYLDKKNFAQVKKKIKSYKLVSWDITYDQVSSELDLIR